MKQKGPGRTGATFPNISKFSAVPTCGIYGTTQPLEPIHTVQRLSATCKSVSREFQRNPIKQNPGTHVPGFHYLLCSILRHAVVRGRPLKAFCTSGILGDRPCLCR